LTISFFIIIIKDEV